jgi:hypothetical protein
MYGHRVTKWLFFGILLVYAPLLAKYLLLFFGLLNPSFPPSLSSFSLFEKMICRGELLLICIPICGASLGELFDNSRNDTVKIATGGASLLVFFSLAVIYVIFEVVTDKGNVQYIEFLLKASYVLTFSTLVLSLAATIVSTEN